LLHWAVNIGFAVAPVIGGLLAHRTFVGLFVADGATTLATVLLIALFVPGSPPPAQHEPVLRGLTRAFRDGPFVVFLVVFLFVSGSGIQAGPPMPLAMGAMGLSAETSGFAIAVNGILIVFLSPPASGVLSRSDPARVLAGASALVGVGFGMNALFASGVG